MILSDVLNCTVPLLNCPRTVPPLPRVFRIKTSIYLSIREASGGGPSGCALLDTGFALVSARSRVLVFFLSFFLFPDGQQIGASKMWWGRRSAPVGPLGADLRVAPCVDTGTLVSMRSSRVSNIVLASLAFPTCVSTSWVVSTVGTRERETSHLSVSRYVGTGSRNTSLLAYFSPPARARGRRHHEQLVPNHKPFRV